MWCGNSRRCYCSRPWQDLPPQKYDLPVGVKSPLWVFRSILRAHKEHCYASTLYYIYSFHCGVETHVGATAAAPDKICHHKSMICRSVSNLPCECLGAFWELTRSIAMLQHCIISIAFIVVWKLTSVLLQPPLTRFATTKVWFAGRCQISLVSV